MVLAFPRKMSDGPATGVRNYGLGRHLWTLTPEQFVGFEKVSTLFNNPIHHTQFIWNLKPRL